MILALAALLISTFMLLIYAILSGIDRRLQRSERVTQPEQPDSKNN